MPKIELIRLSNQDIITSSPVISSPVSSDPYAPPVTEEDEF